MVRSGVQGGGKPLPAESRATFESSMGTDFSDVSIHTGSAANQAAESINAEAYTMGSNIAFASGKYNPGSSGGKELLAHELTHVAQQSGGAQQRARTSRAQGTAVERSPRPLESNGSTDSDILPTVSSGTVYRTPRSKGGLLVQRESESESSTDTSGSIGHEGAEGEASGEAQSSFEGESGQVELGVSGALNGQVSWEVSEVEGSEEPQYQFTLTIGLSGELGGSMDGQVELNQGDSAVQRSAGAVEGSASAEGGVSGGVQYAQTRIFGPRQAEEYQSHLNAIDNTPVESLLDAVDYPEFDIIARMKALTDQPGEYLDGMGGVLGNPSAVDVLEKGESYSLQTQGGWNFSVEGEAATTSGLAIGMGGSAAMEKAWERTVEVERIDAEDAADLEAINETEEKREVIAESLYFDTGKSDPFVGTPAAQNRQVVDEMKHKLGQLQSYGTPDDVEFEIEGHASQRWQAAENPGERQAKNQALSRERASQTANILQMAYNETDASGWPQPNVDARGSSEARESILGFVPSTDFAAFRRADVILRMDEPSPDAQYDTKLRIKVGFSESSQTEGEGGFSVGAAGGGIGYSKAEEEDLYSTFEIYSQLAYFDDFYESLVGARTPEELTSLQQDEVYHRHWVGTEVASGMEEMMGPNFEIGGAKVTLRYGGFSAGSWEVTPDGIQAGEASGGQRVGGNISYGDRELDLPEITTEANIRKIPNGFDVDVQSVWEFWTRQIDGTMISPAELELLAARARGMTEGQWEKHMSFRTYSDPWDFSAESTSFDHWDTFYSKLTSPELAGDLPDELQDQWGTFQTMRQTDSEHREVDLDFVEEQFKNAARANAFRELLRETGSTGRYAVEKVLRHSGGEELGVPFEFPGHLEEEKQELKDLRHVDIPEFVSMAEVELQSIEPGDPINGEVEQAGEDLSERLERLRTLLMNNEDDFDDHQRWAAMVAELDDLKADVREKMNALKQVSDWEPGGEVKDYGAATLWEDIGHKEEVIESYVERFHRVVDEAYDQWGNVSEFWSTSAQDMLPEIEFFERWGEQVDALEELVNTHPDIEVESVQEYVDAYWDGWTITWIVGDYSRWNKLEEIYLDRTHQWNPEERLQEYKTLVGRE